MSWVGRSDLRVDLQMEKTAQCCSGAGMSRVGVTVVAAYAAFLENKSTIKIDGNSI